MQKKSELMMTKQTVGTLALIKSGSFTNEHESSEKDGALSLRGESCEWTPEDCILICLEP